MNGIKKKPFQTLMMELRSLVVVVFNNPESSNRSPVFSRMSTTNTLERGLFSSSFRLFLYKTVVVNYFTGLSSSSLCRQNGLQAIT